ncbi:MAG TPA: hypothetical protein VLF90_04465 [Patescibacteria group bacterium]|nr:hypothetical protein [Patescibacteria group bacterium]
MATQNNTPTGWVGWAYFAGFMMMLVGGMQAIAGLAAIFKSGFYVVSQSHLLVLDYKQWGWVALLLGIIIFFAGLELFRGALWARIVAIILVGMSFLANMAFVNAYPIWAITIMTVDVFVIYALLVHGGELRDDA